MVDIAANADSTGSNVSEFSVSELSGAIKRTMEDAFGRVRVRGELGRVSRPASGHVYLDLKDDRSVIAGVIWKGAASKLPIRPEEGLEVIATGRITTFAGQSKYQIVIDHLEPAGAGALMALLEERKKKLAAEGLFDEARKKPLPYMPKVIGVVTSPTGAVIRDILHRLNDRFPLHVIVWPVRVQGETSADEVARGIVGFNALDGTAGIARPDLLIVARGGGSVEDLWGFNEEIVARAAAMSDIPLISAVGHETDTTLIDYVSDRRAPTPTGAAEIAVPVKAELEAYVSSLSARLRTAITRRLDQSRERLRASSRGMPNEDALLAPSRQRLDGVALRLSGGLERNINVKRVRFAQVSSGVSASRVEARLSYARTHLQRLSHSLPANLERHVATARRMATTSSNRLKPTSVQITIERGKERIFQARDRADRAVELKTERASGDIIRLRRMLQSLSYKSVLARGFSLIRNEAGAPIRSGSDLTNGQGIQIEFGDETQANAMVVGASAKKPAKPKQTSKTVPDQGSLL
ncbi:MAG: exodeoxyribonuclease VII large subunit [Pseudomonadota bacterium]